VNEWLSHKDDGVIKPGTVLKGDSGKEWVIGGLIGQSAEPGGECDADHPSVYSMPDGTTQCRCVVCPRCHHHTGNSHQGHHWAFCSATKTMRDPHFCCPGNCELTSAS
jgi:hypothetical protein